MGDWTFVDVAAHPNDWRARSVGRIEAAANATEPPPPPWPEGRSSDPDEGTEESNRRLHEPGRHRPLEEILSESRDQWRRIRSAAEAIPEQNLLTPGRYPWLGGSPLSEVIVGATAHLHEEHEADIRSWLTARDG